MTLRTRLMIVTIIGLTITITIWGWIQIRTLEGILTDQQGKMLKGIAETVSTYYQHFPSSTGISALDQSLNELIHNDGRLARIDIFSVDAGTVEYIAGAGRVPHEWPEKMIALVSSKHRSRHIKLDMDGRPALGLLYPGLTDIDKQKDGHYVIAAIVFTRAHVEILSRARQLLIASTGGLVFVMVTLMIVSYGWLIGRPLKVIIGTIDRFQKGEYDRRIPKIRSDELGQLADHFNSMAHDIENVLTQNKQLTHSLQERIHETTQKVVQLQQQVNQLQWLKALGYLTATMAHDMGTPLHSIAGMTSLLLEGNEWPPDVRRKLDLILRQTKRLSASIQNVRHATRLPESHLEAVSIGELMDETLPLIEPMIHRSGIHLKVQVDGNLPPLYVDRSRIQTALFNLIQNAMEAMPTGGVIRVTSYTVPNLNQIAISISDSGPGIPPELLDKVYEPFFSTHADEGMRGLGLAIVQDIVKMHNGQMEIKSVPNEGTVVILYLPIVDIKSSAGAPQITSSLDRP